MRKTGFILFLLGLFVLSSCSTTSRLGEGEVLYTGVKKLHVEAVADTIEIPSGVSDNIKEIINVPANNSLYSPYVRSPFPLGLWLYNHWPEDSKGLKGWIYRKFVEEQKLTQIIETLKEKAPNIACEAKIRRMTDYCQSKSIDHVPDPYYGGSEGFENVLDILEDACSGLLEALLSR